MSIAPGAFVAGLVVVRSDYNLRASGDALPIRDAFSALFFMSLGMLLNPVQFTSEGYLLLIGLTVVIVAKPPTAMLTDDRSCAAPAGRDAGADRSGGGPRPPRPVRRGVNALTTDQCHD